MRTLVILIALFLYDLSYGKPLEASLATDIINIDARFTGLNILLFGTRTEGGDIVVVVRGPEKSYIVRKKEPVFGMWMNQKSVIFHNVNDFYAIAATRPLEKIKNDYLLENLDIGTDTLNFKTDSSNGVKEEFREALILGKEKLKLFSSEVKKITIWGETLFRTTLRFPANIPGGIYTAEIYLFSDGQLMSFQTVPIEVSKIGFEAFVSDLAHKRPLVYGGMSVIIAVVSGWLATILFRRHLFKYKN